MALSLSISLFLLHAHTFTASGLTRCGYPITMATALYPLLLCPQWHYFSPSFWFLAHLQWPRSGGDRNRTRHKSDSERARVKKEKHVACHWFKPFESNLISNISIMHGHHLSLEMTAVLNLQTFFVIIILYLCTPLPFVYLWGISNWPQHFVLKPCFWIKSV